MSVMNIPKPDYPIYWDDFGEIESMFEKALDVLADNVGAGEAKLKRVSVSDLKIIVEFEADE